jgi:hypothetical protein
MSQKRAAQEQNVLPLVLSARHHEIVNFLARIGNGDLLDQLHEDRLKIEHGILDTNKAGEITIKIKIGHDGHNKRVVRSEVKSKVPVTPPAETRFFATENGQYVDNDPEQMPLNFRDVGEVGDGRRVQVVETAQLPPARVVS